MKTREHYQIEDVSFEYCRAILATHLSKNPDNFKKISDVFLSILWEENEKLKEQAAIMDLIIASLPISERRRLFNKFKDNKYIPKRTLESLSKVGCQG